MANNISSLKTEMLAMLTNTANLDATTKTKLRNAFVSEYSAEWSVYLAGQSDTATLRATFAIQKTFDFWNDTVRAASNRANVAALPVADTIS